MRVHGSAGCHHDVSPRLRTALIVMVAFTSAGCSVRSLDQEILPEKIPPAVQSRKLNEDLTATPPSLRGDPRPSDIPRGDPIQFRMTAKFVPRTRGGTIFGNLSERIANEQRGALRAVAYLSTDRAYQQADTIATVSDAGTFAVAILPGRAWERITLLVVHREFVSGLPATTDYHMTSWWPSTNGPVLARQDISRSPSKGADR